MPAAKLSLLLILCTALAVVLCGDWISLGLFSVLVLFLWHRSGLPLYQTIRRLMAMDALVVFTVALIPFSVAGKPMFSIMGIPASETGVLMAMMILLKANIVMLAVMALGVGMDAFTLGQALAELRVPRRLVILLQFSVRYIGVLQQEFNRLRQAMKTRGFRATNSLHTWRTYGYLFGMVLVRSSDRAERIWQAMKCRGFSGHFPSQSHRGITNRERLSFFGYLTLVALILSSPSWMA